MRKTIVGIMHHKLFRYLLVGALTYLLYWLILWLSYSLMLHVYTMSVTLAFVISVTFRFFAGRHYTFKAQDANLNSQIAKYIVIMVISYFVQLLVISVLHEQIKLDFYVSTILSSIPVTMLGYLSSRSWIFNYKN
jgi:putative flippase GtrA